jgi:hypothetical protein
MPLSAMMTSIPRSARDEAQLLGSVDLEREEVTRVDADDGSVEPDRALELLDVVSLHEGLEPEPRRSSDEPSGRVVVEIAQEEESCVRSGLAAVRRSSSVVKNPFASSGNAAAARAA